MYNCLEIPGSVDVFQSHTSKTVCRLLSQFYSRHHTDSYSCHLQVVDRTETNCCQETADRGTRCDAVSCVGSSIRVHSQYKLFKIFFYI